MLTNEADLFQIVVMANATFGGGAGYFIGLSITISPPHVLTSPQIHS